MNPDNLEKILLQAGADVRASNIGNGAYVISGPEEGFNRVKSALAEAEKIGRPTYRVSLWLIALSARDQIQHGITNSPFSAQMKATVGSINTPLDYSATLAATLRVASTSTTSRVIGQPEFLINDQTSGEFRRQKRIPYRQTITSTTGVSTQGGVQFMNAGTSIMVSVAEVSPERVEVTTIIELSEVAEQSAENLPIIESRNHTATGILFDHQTVMLASFEQESDFATLPTWYQWMQSKDARTETVQVWCRAERVYQ